MKKSKQEIALQGLSEIVDSLGLDGRVKTAVKVSRLRQGLRHGGVDAYKTIFINAISLNLLIENHLVKTLMKNEKFLDNEGNLSPAISKDLMKLRADTLSYLKMLNSLQSSSKDGKQSNPLAALLNES